MKCVKAIQAKVNEQQMLGWGCKAKSLEVRDPGCYGNHTVRFFGVSKGDPPEIVPLFPTWVDSKLRKIQKRNFGSPYITF